MTIQGITLQVTYTGPVPGALLDDVHDGFDARNQRVNAVKPGPIYLRTGVPTPLVFTSDVAKSFEIGKLRALINTGRATAQFLMGAAFQGGLSSVVELSGSGEVPATATNVRISTAAGEPQIFLPSVVDSGDGHRITFLIWEGALDAILQPVNLTEGVNGPPGSSYRLSALAASATFQADVARKTWWKVSV